MDDALIDPFIDAFTAFAIAEGVRVPELERPMGLLADALACVVAVESVGRSTVLVVDDHLEAALSAVVGPVGDLVRQIAPRVGWEQPYSEYAGEPDMDALRAGYGYATVVGLPGNAYRGAESAPYTSDEVFAGLVLQGPNVVYPAHVHKATEIYWVASGTADWQKGDDWSSHGPGTAIFHDTGVRHATVTGDEPTLMLFAWVTDPESIPVIIRY